MDRQTGGQTGRWRERQISRWMKRQTETEKDTRQTKRKIERQAPRRTTNGKQKDQGKQILALTNNLVMYRQSPIFLWITKNLF